MTLKNAELPPGTAGGATTTHPALSPFCYLLPGHNRSTLRASQTGAGPCMKVGPDFPTVHHARLQLAGGNTDAKSSTNSHISRFWYSPGCTPCATDRGRKGYIRRALIFHGDYLAVLPVCAQQAGGRLLWDRSMSTLSALLRPRLNAHRTRTDKHCVSGWMAWKNSLSPFFVNSHTGSHFAQLLEFGIQKYSSRYRLPW